MPPPDQRATLKLQEQIRFIERSCAIFDAGAHDEALRLATSLRIIFHDKGQSVSLVTQLNQRGENMLSSSRGHGDYKDYLSFRIDISSSEPLITLPLLGTNFREIPLYEWWQHESVFVHKGEAHSRKKIILSAAGKDGGAHVDQALEAYYEILSAGEYGFGITGDLKYHGNAPFKQGVTHYSKNAHLALIRQFAHETVAS